MRRAASTHTVLWQRLMALSCWEVMDREGSELCEKRRNFFAELQHGPVIVDNMDLSYLGRNTF